MRFLCALVLIIGLALPIEAQENRGWSFSGTFSGSANSAGVVTKAEPVLGYRFNRHVSMYSGLPVYFVNLSPPPSDVTASGGFMQGLGNAFLGFRLEANSEMLDYTSNLEFTAPTGDKSRGFSTGRMTVDWTNRFSRTFSSLTPFGSVGIANTVSDTSFFLRPFSSLGVVGHFEGGAAYDISPVVRVGASGYAVRGSGEQRVISRVIRDLPVTTTSVARGRDNLTLRNLFETQTETVSTAELVNDHGFSSWLGVTVTPEVDFHVGYSRSVNYDYNTIFFGIGFHIGH
jgi:hypothetical protein